MSEDKYLEMLNRCIETARDSMLTLEQTIDMHDDFIDALKRKLAEQESKLELLLKERAEYLCPFKAGDYIKGWDYFDKERIAKVIGCSVRTSIWSLLHEHRSHTESD